MTVRYSVLMSAANRCLVRRVRSRFLRGSRIRALVNWIATPAA